MEQLEKKVLITGASRGIGLACASVFWEKNWTPILISRTPPTREPSRSLVAEKPDPSWYQCDITQESDRNNLISALALDHPTIDVIICNAGIGIFKPFDEISEDDFDSIMNTNLKGTFFLLQKLIPFLVKSRVPRIIMVTSDVARRTFSGGSIYTMSKFAQDSLVQTLKKELRPLGIQVSVIMPGLTDTSFGNSEEGAPHKQEWLKPSDVANAIYYMATPPSNVVIDEMLIHPFCQDYQL